MADLENMKSMRDINDYCVSKGLYTLAQGMIEVAPPRKLRELVGEVAMEEGLHCYRARMGEPEFLEGVTKVLKAEGCPADVGVLATQGVSGGIVSSVLYLKKQLGRAPRVALLEPFYTYHLHQIKAVADLDPVFITAKSEGDGKHAFDLSLESLKASLPDIDCLLMCNPQNPTGKTWTQDELDKVVAMVTGAGKLLVVDECYADMSFAWKHKSPIHKELRDDVIVCRGFSKTLGAQSWRVGYVASTQKTVEAMMVVMDPIYICTPFLQHAVARFLTNHEQDYYNHIAELTALLRSNWELLREAFAARFPTWQPIEPQGTMYANFTHDRTSDLAAVKDALAAGVGVCPGSMFTREGITPTANTHTIRIHCGISREKTLKICELLKNNA